MKTASRHILALLSLLLAQCLLCGKSSVASAQTNGCNSPYSRFGLGLLGDQPQGFNKSMGGVGLGVRIGNRVNTINPASYSAIDSLSLIMDIGMKASFGQMKQGGTTAGVKNATLDYVHLGMRLAKGLGLSAGFMPYSNIGYSFYSDDQTIGVVGNSERTVTNANLYDGDGGLNLAYIGLGWKAYRNLSVGANVGFLWGKYNHDITQLFEEDGISSSTYSATFKNIHSSMKTFKLDFGAQYPIRLTRQDWLTVGVTAGIGHKIAQDATLVIYTSNGDSTLYTASKPFDLPFSFAGGVAWQHKNTLLVAADFQHELWSKCRLPIETRDSFVPMKGYYNNKTKIAVGTQWTPNPFGKYWQRIQYRAGINFTTPYLRVNGNDGPNELSMCIGAGLPIMNRWNNRSVINFGLQWMRRSASAPGMITENYLLLNFGFTFNERWFTKYKIQ